MSRSVSRRSFGGWRRVRGWLGLFALLTALLGAAGVFGPVDEVEAQRRSGGSFGGGSFGGRSGGRSFGGGGRSSGSWGHGGMGRRTGYSPGVPFIVVGGGGGGGDGASASGSGSSGGIPPGMIAIVGLAGLLMFMHLIRRHGAMVPGPQSSAWNHVDITAVRVALDGRARAELQRELARFAHHGSTDSTAALAAMLRATAASLRRHRDAWRYAGVANHVPMSPPIAEGIFRRLAADARATFEEELVRSAAGDVRVADAAPFTPIAHEGEGVVLITIVAAAHTELLDVHRADPSAIERLLASLEILETGDLVALEIVWTPADENDRMSTASLEARHPDLIRLGDLGGLVQCAHCGGPFTMELPACPHCGAPNTASRPATGHGRAPG
jgi:uncharacterized membrane protein